MSDGIGKIVEGYNSVISALENNRVLELVTLEKNIDSKKVQDLIEIAQQKKAKVTNIKSKNEWQFTSTEYVAAPVSYTHLTLPTKA